MAYIDEVEERESGGAQKVYYSVLVKGVDNLDQVTILINCKQSNLSLLQCHNCWLVLSSLKEIYRIKLPGTAKLGEGKPENQNHAIIFTRGEALQTIDMNQVRQ